MSRAGFLLEVQCSPVYPQLHGFESGFVIYKSIQDDQFNCTIYNGKPYVTKLKSYHR